MPLFSIDDAMMVFSLNDFLSLLQVVDCRVCGDPNSVLRFAFIEFTDEGIIKSYHTSCIH